MYRFLWVAGSSSTPTHQSLTPPQWTALPKDSSTSEEAKPCILFSVVMWYFERDRGPFIFAVTCEWEQLPQNRPERWFLQTHGQDQKSPRSHTQTTVQYFPIVVCCSRRCSYTITWLFWTSVSISWRTSCAMFWTYHLMLCSFEGMPLHQGRAFS